MHGSPTTWSRVETAAAEPRLEAHPVGFPAAELLTPDAMFVKQSQQLYGLSEAGDRIVVVDADTMENKKELLLPDLSSTVTARPASDEIWAGTEDGLVVVETLTDALERIVALEGINPSSMAFDHRGERLYLLQESEMGAGDFCEAVASAVSYDGCLLPDDPGQQQQWTVSPGSNGEPFTDGCAGLCQDDCQLVIPVPDPEGHYGYRRWDGALETAGAYAMTARVRAEDFYLQGYYTNASFGISDGLKNAFIALTHNDSGETWAVACDQTTCESVAVDWTAFHEYRFTVSKQGKARFYLDGVLFYETDYELLRDSIIPPQLSVFGGSESISYWDQVHYEICAGPGAGPYETCVAEIEPESGSVSAGACIQAAGCRLLPVFPGGRSFVACSDPGVLAHLELDSLDFSSMAELDFAPAGMATTIGAGSLLLTDPAAGTLRAFDPDSLEQLWSLPGLPGAATISVNDQDGSVVVAGQDAVVPALYHVDPAMPGVVDTLALPAEPSGLVPEPEGSGFFVSLPETGAMGVVKDLGVQAVVPTARAGMAGVFDKGSGEFLVFGGQTEAGLSDELWALEVDSMSWRRVERGSVDGQPAPWPAARAYYAHDYDQARRTLYLFGGLGQSGPLSDLWALDLDTRRFRRLDMGAQTMPAGRYQASCAYIPQRDSLFIGFGTHGSPSYADAWMFDLSSGDWEEVTPDCGQQPCPPAMKGAVAVISSAGDRVFLVGGTPDEPTEEPRRWSFDLEAGEWIADREHSEAGTVSGGLVVAKYLNKHFGLKLDEAFDEQPLDASWSRDRRRPSSRRWFGEIFIEQTGDYSFRVQTSGGSRVFLDERLLAFEQHGGRCGHRCRSTFGTCRALDSVTRPIHLTAGWHAFVLDMTECGRNAYVHVEIEDGPAGPGPIPADAFRVPSRPGLNRRAYLTVGPFEWMLGEDVDTTAISDFWERGLPVHLGGGFLPAFFKKLEWSGKVLINEAGTYRFEVDSRSPTMLTIDGQLVLRAFRWFARGRRGQVVSDPVHLETGWHDVSLEIRGRRGEVGAELRFHDSCPHLPGNRVPASLFSASVPGPAY